MKKAYYFSHDSNARRDPKILAMREVFGAEGYGWWWMLIEILREQAGYLLPKTKFVWKTLASEFQTSSDEAKNFVEACIKEFELLSETEKYIWSDSLLRRMQKMDQVIEKKRQAAQKRWDKEKDISEPGDQHTRDANALQMKCNSTSYAMPLNEIEKVNLNQFNENKENKTEPPDPDSAYNEVMIIGKTDDIPEWSHPIVGWAAIKFGGAIKLAKDDSEEARSAYIGEYERLLSVYYTPKKS